MSGAVWGRLVAFGRVSVMVEAMPGRRVALSGVGFPQHPLFDGVAEFGADRAEEYAEILDELAKAIREAAAQS